MYANITDSLNALAKKIKADPNGKDIESALSNISVKLGGKKSVGNTVAHAIDNITEVVDIDTMHVVKHKSITANGVYDASDDDADGYDQVTVNVAGSEPFAVTITAQGEPGSYTFSANKTYSETMAAIQNGDVISFTLIIGEYTGNDKGYFIMYTESDEIITVVINAEDTGTKAIEVLKWYSDDTLDAAVYIPQS